MYNKLVEEYFFDPKHVGFINADEPLAVHNRMSQEGQPLVIDFYLQCTQGQMIKRACYQTNGNPYVIAALEFVCRQIEGLNLKQLPEIGYQQLVTALEIPNAQYPSAIQVEKIYKNALLLLKNKIEGVEP